MNVKVIRQVVLKKNADDLQKLSWEKIHPQIKMMIEANMGNVSNNLFTQEPMWKFLIDNNFWIEYFFQCPMYQKDNWIDFESEISKVVHSLDQDMKENNFKLEDSASVVNNFYLERFFHNKLPAAILDFGQEVKVITIKKLETFYIMI